MVEALCVRQRPGVDRDLVQRAREAAAGRAAPTRVPTDAPVAGVVLCRGLRVRAHQFAVDVELHAVGALLSEHVVPLAVVVGLRRGDEVLLAGVDAEPELSTVEHVHVAVVVARVAGLAVAEADQLAAPGCGGLEPQLLAEGARVAVRPFGHDPVVSPVEGRGGVTDQADAGLGPLHGAVEVPADRFVRSHIRSNRASRLRQTPVEVGLAGPDRAAVRISGRDHARQRPAAGQVVLADVVDAQRRGIDRNIVDLAVEVSVGAPRGVPAHSPVAGVLLRRGGVGAAGDLTAVNVQNHPSTAQCGDGMVPLPVVVGLGRVDRPSGPWVDAEGQLTVRQHVDMPVVAAAVARVRVAEADDLAARVGGGLEPGLDREHLRPHLGSRRRDQAGGVAGEGRTRVLVVDDGSRLPAGHACVDSSVVEAGPIVGGVRCVSAVLSESPVVGRRVVQHGLSVGRVLPRRARGYDGGVAP